MDVHAKIKKLLQEGELYRKQSLLNEAKSKYTSAAALIQKIDKIKNKETILQGVNKKIRAIDLEIERYEKADATPEVTSEIQDLIKEKFAFAKGESAALEGAIALAKFGQFDRALQEFHDLFEKESFRIAAAKNIIRCHVALESIEKAVEEYQQWIAGDLFTQAQSTNLRIFFQNILDKKGMDVKLDQMAASQASEAEEIEAPELETLELDSAEPEAAAAMSLEDELLDISSIGILMESGPQAGNVVEFDVSFQSGNEISLLIPKKEQEVIEHLTVGTKLDDIEFYSPFAMFKGSGIVSANTKIGTGPKRGDFSLDIKVTGT